MLGVLSILYQNVDWKVVAIPLPVIPILIHVIPYLVDSHKIRKYPGPFFAKFSDIWLGWVCKSGHRSEVVHQIHQKYGTPRLSFRSLFRPTYGHLFPGTFVRIAPNHVSIAEPDALGVIYGHGNGALKS